MMGEHLYWEAAEILKQVTQKKAAIKTLVYSSGYKNKNKLLALVSQCCQFQSLLQEVLQGCTSAFLEEELVQGSREFALILLYEHLVGKGFGKNVYIRKVVRKHKNEIDASCKIVLQKHNLTSLRKTLQAKNENLSGIPRYMRINLIKHNIEEVLEKLQAGGWNYVGQLNLQRFAEAAVSLGKSQFGLDPLLPDVLVFPAGTDLHSHPMTTSGILVQQSRASCVPAHVLEPKPGTVVLDCCAAPGNKTSHLASLMRNQGRVVALDRDERRVKMLQSLVEMCGASCVEVIHQDFLTVAHSSDDAKDIQMILIDPSCSGSGMEQRQAIEERTDPGRLQTLKGFQSSILKHALRFPAVQRVVYSTCSIHKEENEEVVEEVMANVSKYFCFKPVLPQWSESRGLPEFPHWKCFLRLTPQNDLTTGFFVALFERIRSKADVNFDEDDGGKETGSAAVNDEKNSDSTFSDHKVDELKHSVENSLVNQSADPPRKKRKKHKERQREDVTEGVTNAMFDDKSLKEDVEAPTELDQPKHKKKKKHKKNTDDDLVLGLDDEQEAETAAGSERKNKEQEIRCSESLEAAQSKKKKKHKKSRRDDRVTEDDDCQTVTTNETDGKMEERESDMRVKRKKNKKRSLEMEEEIEVKKKKKNYEKGK